MMMRTVASLAAVVGVLVAPVDAQKPALADVLARAAEYHASYVSSVSGATLEEHFTLVQVNAGRMLTPVHFSSDVVLVNVNGRLIGMRDPFAVDNVPLRERAPRIASMLANPTMDAWQRAQEFVAEQYFRFLDELIIRMNDPALPLLFIARDVQPKMTFKLEAHEQMNGVPVVRVGFKETVISEAKLMLETRGNAAATGRFWIEAATGAIQKAELWGTSATEAVVKKVTFAKDSKLGLWLPEKMNETYDWKEIDDVASNRNVGAYGARLFFQTKATYTNPRYTPIDLTKIRR